MTIMSSLQIDAAVCRHPASILHHPNSSRHQSPVQNRAPMAIKHWDRVHVHWLSEIRNPTRFRMMSDRGPIPTTRSNPFHPIKSLWSVGRPSDRRSRGMFVVVTLVPAMFWTTFWMWCSRTFLGILKGLGPSPQTIPCPFPSRPHPSGTSIGWSWEWSSWSQWPGMWWHGFPCTFLECKDFAHFPYDSNGDFGGSFETILSLYFFDNNLK